MNIFQAIFLGIIQGLTEFLPVSSSGHLVLAQHFLNLHEASVLFAFDVAVHLGTLLAVVFFFAREVGEMIQKPFSRLSLMVVVATLPAVVVGLFFKDQIESLFVSPRVAGFGLLVTGTILWFTRFVEQRMREVRAPGFWGALLVGLFQAVAITPGISRSGSTIAAGLMTSWDRSFAARFSFLISIPAILGALTLELWDLKTGAIQAAALPWGPIGIGTIFSAITGFLAIQWMLKIIAQRRFHWFAYYCWAVGLISLMVL